MFRALYTAASGMIAQQYNLDNVANNLANASTAAFRGRRLQFEDLLYQDLMTPGAAATQQTNFSSGLQIGLGTRTATSEVLQTQGDATNTGNPLDLMIQGQGFFQVKQPDGQIAYTRSGAFQLDQQGNIVTADGNPLQPAITIPSNAQTITVGTDGTVSITLPGQQQSQQVGIVQLATFPNPGGLQSVGQNLLTPTTASGEPVVGNPGDAGGLGTLQQGTLEQSNIDVVQEFAVVALFLVPSLMGAASSPQPRIRIPKFAEVQGETIRLSDLLPPDAPADLEQIGARIALGDSPDPACQRVLSKDQIELQLREFPSIWERLELPERLIVSLKQRRLSPNDIWTVIESFLAAEGLSAAGAVPQRLPSHQETVFVTKQDPGLMVKRMEPDRVRRQIRSLLWTSNEPRVLPPYVTVEEPPRTAGRLWSSHADAGPAANLPLNSEGLSKTEEESFAGLLIGSRSGVRADKARFTPPPASPAIILVTKGKPAKLAVETQTLRMTALVTPLASGAQGQVIRVRNLDTQRVFKAEVVGKGLLQAELAGEYRAITYLARCAPGP